MMADLVMPAVVLMLTVLYGHQTLMLRRAYRREAQYRELLMEHATSVPARILTPDKGKAIGSALGPKSCPSQDASRPG